MLTSFGGDSRVHIICLLGDSCQEDVVSRCGLHKKKED